MIINHNIAALNTYRQLTSVNTASSRSLEKLSSGLRINRAGDDAAGLAISEKMRGQIRGLEQAVRNAQDAISLIQTAEGALNETHSILQRMRELAVQAANDAATSADRAAIQKEVDELAKEITRISNTSEFNTKNLLAGGFNSTFHIGANAGQNISLSIGAMDAKTLGVAADSITTSFTGSNTGITSLSDQGYGFTATSYQITTTKTAASAGTVSQSNTNGGAGTADVTNWTGSANTTWTVRIDSVDAGTGKVLTASYSTDGTTYINATVDTSGGNTVVTLTDGAKLTIATDTDNAVNDTYTFTGTAATGTIQLKDGAGNNIGSAVTVNYSSTSAVIGDVATGNSVRVNFSFASLSAGTDTVTQSVTASTAATVAADGTVTTLAVAQKGINVSTQTNASNAITTINNAIQTVSSERAKLGAFQNRLEHTINNLGTASENLSAAESRIRDVDMAKEIMEFTKNSIIAQAATAMLAQANQVPQQVLQLLR